mmetsp:Transcript_17791/g.31690  ORF Transcript_17791/g.31690 Transcript_17791/m.31690 type:complete len:313 (+) Transcript_17791:188-1126(+)
MGSPRALRRLRAFAHVNAAVVAVAAIAHELGAQAQVHALKEGLGGIDTADWMRLYLSAAIKTAAFLVIITASAARRPKILGEKRTKEPQPQDTAKLVVLALTTGLFEAVELAYVARFLDLDAPTWSIAEMWNKFGIADALTLVQQLPTMWLVFVIKSFAFEILFDFFHYWGHRIAHEIPRLYRFHRSHHKYLHPTPLATYQQHPFDIVFTNLLPNVAAVVLLRTFLGIQLNSFEYSLLMSYKVFVEIAGHAGIETTATSFPQCAPLPEALGIELHTDDHDLHHSFPGMACNYAKRFTLWDRVFGTYKVHKSQ